MLTPVKVKSRLTCEIHSFYSNCVRLVSDSVFFFMKQQSTDFYIARAQARFASLTEKTAPKQTKNVFVHNILILMARNDYNRNFFFFNSQTNINIS